MASWTSLTSNDIRDTPNDSGALAKLDLSGNYSFTGGSRSNKSQEFIRPIASMLKTNRTIKELSLAGNSLNAEAARIFSQDIHDNGALASLDISNNSLTQGEPRYANRPHLGHKTDMSGVIALCEALKK